MVCIFIFDVVTVKTENWGVAATPTPLPTNSALPTLWQLQIKEKT